MNIITTTAHPLDNQALQKVIQPIEQANGLPNQAYNSADFFTHERQTLMAATWAAIGFASDLPQASYVKPVNFMGLPLVMIKDTQGAIRVFHNVCSHRGMTLVSDAGVITGNIRCPYHSWTYTLEGQLKGTPHIGGVGVHQIDTMDCSQHGMKEINCHVWFDVVFINLDGKAPNFNHFIQPIMDRWHQYIGTDGLDCLRTDATQGKLHLDVACNWKLAVENYCESYHLPWIHPELNSYSRIQDHYHIMFEHFAGQGSYVYNLAQSAGTHLPRFNDWPQDKIKQAEYITVFPNVLLGLQADHAFAIILEPNSHARTHEHLRLMYVGDEALSPAYSAHREATMEAWKTVFKQDIAVVEGMQRGRNSPSFNGGVFSPVLDNPTHYFHQWVAQHGLADA